MHKVQVAPTKPTHGAIAIKSDEDPDGRTDLMKLSSFSRVLKNEEPLPLAVLFFTLTKLHNK